MKITNIDVFNFQNALRGMRHPLESYAKSDSEFFIGDGDTTHDAVVKTAKMYDEDPQDPVVYQKYADKTILHASNNSYQFAAIGPNDISLAQRLIAAGPEHRKFMRQIFVSMDIEAPIYWWKELDTYKLGTTANSTSTMHKLASKPITLDCFEIDDYNSVIFDDNANPFDQKLDIDAHVSEDIISFLELLRQKYNDTKNKDYWKELVRWLPMGWLQTRTWTCNYENLYSIVRQREGHKLTEWHTFIDTIKTLPYAQELIFFNKN